MYAKAEIISDNMVVCVAVTSCFHECWRVYPFLSLSTSQRRGSKYMHQSKGEMTSPWSIPILTLYRSESPSAVKTAFLLLVNRLIMRSMYDCGILILARASLSILRLTLSYALDKSCIS